MTVVDTSVWIAYFRNARSAPVAALTQLPTADIVVGDIILLEILQGARDDAHALKIETELRAFPIAPMLGDTRAAEAAAHYRALRALGVTVRKTTDLIIATWCIAHGCTLLHQDRDFDPFAKHCGLRVTA